MDIHFDDEFIKASKKLSQADKALTKKAITLILRYYKGDTVPHGLGLKKLGLTSEGRVWEARVGLHWRILFLENKDHSSLFFRRISTHEEVQRFLKSFL